MCGKSQNKVICTCVGMNTIWATFCTLFTLKMHHAQLMFLNYLLSVVSVSSYCSVIQARKVFHPSATKLTNSTLQTNQGLVEVKAGGEHIYACHSQLHASV